MKQFVLKPDSNHSKRGHAVSVLLIGSKASVCACQKELDREREREGERGEKNKTKQKQKRNNESRGHDESENNKNHWDGNVHKSTMRSSGT
jgi:hypothetical protein